MKKRHAMLLAFAATALGAVSALQAAVKPAPVFADHMVLQRELDVPVWGTADAGEEVTVAFAGQRLTATADEQGQWMVQLKGLQANAEPQELTITGKDSSVTIRDVLVGELGTVQHGDAAVDGAVPLGQRRRRQDRRRQRQPAHPHHPDASLRLEPPPPH